MSGFALGDIWVYAFSEILKEQGVTTTRKFQKWITEEGDKFLHSEHVAQPGDVLVYAWKEKGEWLLVGDAIIKLNEELEKVIKVNGRKLKRRIVAGNVRTYEQKVNLKTITNKTMKPFLKLKPKQYLSLLQKSIKDLKQ